MFAINKELLSKRNHPEEYAWMESKIKEIREEGKKYYMFRAYKNPTHVQDDRGRHIKVPRRRLVPREVSFQNDEMGGVHQTWYFGQTMASFKNVHGLIELTFKSLLLNENEVFSTEKDMETIFFLRYLSKNPYVSEYDPEKLNRLKAEQEGLEIEARSIIFSKQSILHPEKIGSEEPLRSLASIWGMGDISDMGIHTVMTGLWDRVQHSQKNYHNSKRGYAEFVREALKIGDGDKRSTIILGIERGTLVCRDNIWFVLTKGGTEQILCAVTGPSSSRDEELIKYLTGNDRAYEIVELAVNNGDNSLVTERGSKMSRADLMDKCNVELLWPKAELVKMKNVEIQELLDNKTKYVKE